MAGYPFKYYTQTLKLTGLHLLIEQYKYALYAAVF